MGRLWVSGHHCKCTTTIGTILFSKFSMSAVVSNCLGVTQKKDNGYKNTIQLNWAINASEVIIIRFPLKIQTLILKVKWPTGEEGVLPLSIHLPGFRLWRLARLIHRILILRALGPHYTTSPPWQFEDWIERWLDRIFSSMSCFGIRSSSIIIFLEI